MHVKVLGVVKQPGKILHVILYFDIFYKPHKSMDVGLEDFFLALASQPSHSLTSVYMYDQNIARN